jgi:hypothetical protein
MRRPGKSWVLLTLLASSMGIAGGAASVNDIRGAQSGGYFTAAAVPAPAISGPFPEDDPIADGHGYALASALGVRKASNCNKVAREFQRGCMARVADASAGLLGRASGEEMLSIFGK